MFPGHSTRQHWLYHIPRIRGGVSTSLAPVFSLIAYSPHPRGCFRGQPCLGPSLLIFPASAGVFLSLPADPRPGCHIPRIRGGVSLLHLPRRLSMLYSPHPRGCFLLQIVDLVPRHIFPASAGVFLPSCLQYASPRNIPRIRGGVSITNSTYYSGTTYSPHPRGCFSIYGLL